MVEWLEWARGPAFRFALLFLLLGSARLLLLTVSDLYTLVRRTKGRELPLKRALTATARWLVPFGKTSGRKVPFVIVSMLFHISIILVPIFLSAHIMLWQRGLGLSWPALSNSVATLLTFVAIVTALILFFERALSKTARALSRPQDFFFLLLVLTCFSSGLLAMHPAANPFTYDATMLVHVLSGDLSLALLPFSKLSHAILYPATQLISELGWHLAPDSGRAVARDLGKEGEAI